jgi:hypothetical protein
LLRCLFIILWENIKLICFPCDSSIGGTQQTPKGRERNTTWEEVRVYNNHYLISWYPNFWHAISSNTYIIKLHHEKILFLHFLSCPIVQGLVVTRIWMFSGILGLVILLIVCCTIISWDMSFRGEKRIMLRVSLSPFHVIAIFYSMDSLQYWLNLCSMWWCLLLPLHCWSSKRQSSPSYGFICNTNYIAKPGCKNWSELRLASETACFHCAWGEIRAKGTTWQLCEWNKKKSHL